MHTKRLQTQCNNMEIPTINSERDLETSLANSDVILDAIFGFSFQPPIRAPFDTALQLISSSKLPIVSVDVPSGKIFCKLNTILPTPYRLECRDGQQGWCWTLARSPR